MLKKFYIYAKTNLKKLIKNYIFKINHFSYELKVFWESKTDIHSQQALTLDFSKVIAKYEDYINTRDLQHVEALAELEKTPSEFGLKNSIRMITNVDLLSTLLSFCGVLHLAKYLVCSTIVTSAWFLYYNDPEKTRELDLTDVRIKEEIAEIEKEIACILEETKYYTDALALMNEETNSSERLNVDRQGE